MAKFKVLELSYINGGLREPGYIFEYDQKKWRKDLDTNICPAAGKDSVEIPSTDTGDLMAPYTAGKQAGSEVDSQAPQGVQPSDEPLA